MAKSKKPKSPVTKKPSKQDLKQKALNKEYAKQRKLLLQNVHRLEARGYDVSKIKIPQIPEKKNKQAINEIKRINANRYKYATHEVEVIKGKGTKNERIEVTKVKGTKYAKQENKIRAEKAAATRRENKIRKKEQEQKEFQDWVDEVNKYKDIDITRDEPYKMRPDLSDNPPRYPEDDDSDSGKPERPFGEWFNKDTGEIITGPKPYGNEWISTNDAIRDYFDKSFDSAMKRVQDMQVYEGKDKRARDIRSNADKIADKLRDEYSRDPITTGKVIKEMEDMGLFEDIETWYFSGGYNKFVYNFNLMFGLFEDYGAINDETEFTNYDE